MIALTGIDVNAKVSGNNLSELQAIAGSTQLPDTGPFTASARLTGTAKALAMRDALTVIKQKGSQLKVSGKIANLQQLSGIDLSFKGSAKDFTELDPTFGTQLPDLGAFQISGQLLGSSDVLDLKNVSAVIDQSDFSAAGQVTFGQRPKVSMQIESALIDFTRLMGEAEKQSPPESSRLKGNGFLENMSASGSCTLLVSCCDCFSASPISRVKSISADSIRILTLGRWPNVTWPAALKSLWSITVETFFRSRTSLDPSSCPLI